VRKTVLAFAVINDAANCGCNFPQTSCCVLYDRRTGKFGLF
jgi:hypothetical protein